MAYRFFLSHNSADLAIVREIKQRSEAAGVSVYLYEDNVQAGGNLAAKLTDAIKASDALVAILTRTAAPRAAIQQEIGAAVALNKRVIALVEPGVDPASLTLLQGVEYIRLDLDRLNEALLALQRSVTEHQATLQRELIFGVLAIAAIVGLIYLNHEA